MESIVCPESMKVNYIKNKGFTALVLIKLDFFNNLNWQWKCVAIDHLSRFEALSGAVSSSQ